MGEIYSFSENAISSVECCKGNLTIEAWSLNIFSDEDKVFS